MAKQVKVKAVRQFLSREGLIKRGATLDVTEKRAEELVKAGRAELVQTPKGDK